MHGCSVLFRINMNRPLSIMFASADRLKLPLSCNCLLEHSLTKNCTKKTALLSKSINQKRKSASQSLMRATKRHPFDILTGSSGCSVGVYVCI